MASNNRRAAMTAGTALLARRGRARYTVEPAIWGVAKR